MNRAGTIIDFHAHAFPDPVAERAIPALEEAGDVQAFTDGTVSRLLASMDRAGIEKSVICSIATRVEQFEPILDWSKKIQSDRIIPLPSVHPEDPLLVEHIRLIRQQGFAGIKLHPYYQHFYLGEERLARLYRAVCDNNLLLVAHTGFDIAYPRERLADPEQVVRVLERFPELKLITTHLGGWDDWNEVQRLLLGRPVFMEISFALDYLSPERARELITGHLPEYLLFGTDSPWADQARCVQQLLELELDEGLLESILWKNALRLLDGKYAPDEG